MQEQLSVRHEVVAVTRRDLDVTSADAVLAFATGDGASRPGWIRDALTAIDP